MSSSNDAVNTSNTSSAAVKSSSKWTDEEDLALVVAITKSFKGKVKWADVKIPRGRTTDACAKRFENLAKSVAHVPMDEGSSSGAHKRKAKGASTEDAPSQPVAKRTRKLKTAEPAANDGEDNYATDDDSSASVDPETTMEDVKDENEDGAKEVDEDGVEDVHKADEDD